MENKTNKKLSQFCQKAITFLAYFSAIIPIFFWLTSIFPMVLPKTLLFRGTVEIMLIFYLILIYADKNFLPKLNKFNLSLIIFTLISFVSGFVGINPFHSMFSTAERMMGNFGFLHFVIFILILSSVIKTKNLWLKILSFWAWFTSIINLIFYLLTIVPHSPVSILNSEPGRYVGFTGNSTFTGVSLLMQAFLCLYLFFENIEKDNKKLHFFFLFLINSYLLFLSGCRGSMVALMAGLGMLLISFNCLGNSKISDLFHINVRKWSLFILIGITVCGIIFITIRETPLVKNNIPLQRLTSIPFLNASALSRLMVARIAMKTFLQRPLLGWGPENFEIAYQRNYNLEIAKILPSDNRFDKVHNMPLEILSTTGILGFISYLCIFFFFYTELKKNESFEFWPKLILILGVLGYFIQNIFLFDVLEGLVPLFLIFAFTNSQYSPLKISFKFSLPKWLQIFLISLCIPGLLVVLYIYNIKIIDASSKVIIAKESLKAGKIEKAIDLIKSNYSTRIFIQDFFIFGDLDFIVGGDLSKLNKEQINTIYNLVFNQAKSLSRIQPYNLRLYIARLLSIMAKTRVTNSALDETSIKEARIINDEIQDIKLYLPDIEFYYAQLLLKSANKQDQEEAIKLLKEFHLKFPKISRAPWFIGAYLVVNGRVEEGLSYLQKAVEIGSIFQTPREALSAIELFLKYGDSKTALKLSQILEKEVKNEPLVYLVISKVYIAEKDNKKALEYIMRAKQLYDIYATKKTDEAMEKEINRILNQLTP